MGLISFIVPFSSRVDELELKIEQLVSLAAEVKQHDFELTLLNLQLAYVIYKQKRTKSQLFF